MTKNQILQDLKSLEQAVLNARVETGVDPHPLNVLKVQQAELLYLKAKNNYLKALK